MRYVDLRVIFDTEEQQLVVGCHNCEKTTCTDIKDIPNAATVMPKFAMEHLQECGTNS